MSSGGLLHGENRYLFVLGHMRAFTTVLCHILGSHPDVLGYREHHLSHDSLASLKRLRRAMEAEALAGKSGATILLDKLPPDLKVFRPRVPTCSRP